MGRTWDYLPQLGFAPQTVPDDRNPEACYDFGTFVLTASDTMGKYFRQVVAFAGNYSTPRSIGVIEFELPEDVASIEQCAAMIYYYLRHYEVVFEPDWWTSAEANQQLLPWKNQR